MKDSILPDYLPSALDYIPRIPIPYVYQDRHARFDYLISLLGFYRDRADRRITLAVFSRWVGTDPTDNVIWPRPRSPIYIVNRTASAQPPADILSGDHYDLVVGVDALSSCDRSPAIYNAVELTRCIGGKRQPVPLDIRPFLDIPIPRTVLVPYSTPHPTMCPYAEMSIDGGEIAYARKGHASDPPPLQQMLSLPNAIDLPAQPLHERILAVLTDRRINYHVPGDNPMNRWYRRLLIVFYDDQGEPISPVLMTSTISTLLFPPCITAVMRKYRHTVVEGVMMLARAFYMNVGTYPLVPSVPTFNPQVSLVPNNLVATLLLNTVIYRYGEHIVPDIINEVDRVLERSGRLFSSSQIAQNVSRDHQIIYHDRSSVPEMYTHTVQTPVFNSGTFLWSSPLILDGTITRTVKRSGLSALAEVLFSNVLHLRHRAQQAVRLLNKEEH